MHISTLDEIITEKPSVAEILGELRTATADDIAHRRKAIAKLEVAFPAIVGDAGHGEESSTPTPPTALTPVNRPGPRVAPAAGSWYVRGTSGMPHEDDVET